MSDTTAGDGYNDTVDSDDEYAYKLTAPDPDSQWYWIMRCARAASQVASARVISDTKQTCKDAMADTERAVCSSLDRSMMWSHWVRKYHVPLRVRPIGPTGHFLSSHERDRIIVHVNEKWFDTKDKRTLRCVSMLCALFVEQGQDEAGLDAKVLAVRDWFFNGG